MKYYKYMLKYIFMCGIVCGIYYNIYKVLLDGLYQLQNRGYDSAGITVVSGSKFVTFKRATTEKESAIDYLKRNNINGTIVTAARIR